MANHLAIESLAKMIIKTGALKFGVYELSSGAISPYYLDLRLIPGEPLAFISVVNMLEEMMIKMGRGEFERIGGVPTAGVPYAAAISYKMRKPFIYVRKEAKPHGGQKMVEGLLLPGECSVAIVVCSEHRAPAFEACRFAIDTLKKIVPIWKKEVYEDGEVWIEGGN